MSDFGATEAAEVPEPPIYQVMTNREKEFNVCEREKLTTLTDSGHYELKPQRGCFLRCERCYNLSEADSYERNGLWQFKEECLFCVQRAIDLLGYYEHGIIPETTVLPTPKSRNTTDTDDIYTALERAAEALSLDEE